MSYIKAQHGLGTPQKYMFKLAEDTNVYGNSSNENIVTTIPKDTQVYVSNKANSKNYKKIKWGNYYGWTYNPSYPSYYSSYIPAKKLQYVYIFL